jgi:RHS repeat-associated protein
MSRLQGGNIVKQYYYDTAGQMIMEANADGTTARAEIYAGSRHLATWSNNSTYFNHADWLGTERVRSFGSGTKTGQICETITSLPFGDGLSTVPQNGGCTPDPSPNYFTGKERDSETGLDYFGARYNASTIGRFMTPDPSGKEAVKVDDPQTWNMYAYARNNPTTFTDPNGLCTADGESHNWVWCAAHAVGLTTTLQERRDWLAQNIAVTQGGRTISNYWSTASVAEVNDEYNRGTAAVAMDTTFSIFTPVMWGAAKDLVSGGPSSEAVTPFMTTWGWSGSPAYNDAVNELRQAGTHETLGGKVPTQAEASKMIEESGGTVDRIEEGHGPGSVSTHSYPHINYTTASGLKATVQIQQVGP